jgi:G3E family GTPase
MAPDADAGRVPVTILTGFLGAGKTTLLRHVLSQKHGLKIAVIQNELSATTGLEAATMRGPNGEWFDKWMELANGCVCCEVRDELPFAIERLMEAKGRFNHVLIETTGMADPGPVAASLWLDDALESPLQLDGIVTVVDAQHGPRHLDTVESCRQIASADVIILNKCDCATDAGLTRLVAQLRTINLLAPIRRTSQSAVPLDDIFNLQAYAREEGVRALARTKRAPEGSGEGGKGLERATRVARAEAGGEAALAAGLCACCEQPVCGACEPPPEGNGEEDGKDGPPPADGEGRRDAHSLSVVGVPGGATRYLHRDGHFGSVTLQLGLTPLRLEALQAYLAVLFWEGEEGEGRAAGHGARLEPELGGEVGVPDAGGQDGGAGAAPEVYRAKGLVAIAPDPPSLAGDGAPHRYSPACPPQRYTLQAVHETWELAEGPPWREDELPESRFVFIGRNLEAGRIRSALEDCRVQGGGDAASG